MKMSVQNRDSQWDRRGVISGILKGVSIPMMARVKQKFNSERISDIQAAVKAEVAASRVFERIKTGNRIAITVGSRGIANLEILVRSLVTEVRRFGGKPFIVPAMGSHGGATADGQTAILSSMGVTEQNIGAPIRSSMDTVKIGKNAEGKPVYMDRFAAEADGVIVFNRVKSHTAFRGACESGLMKMMVIGLGNQQGAEAVHAESFGRMAYNVCSYGAAVLGCGKVLFGLAAIENAFDETSRLIALSPEQIPEREPELLREAKDLMPRIMFDSFDVLIVDRIGKNFSGDGMDPNITASYATPYAGGGPNIERYVVLDLTEETHGSAIGVGMADFTTKRLFDKIDFDETYPNALTSRVTGVAKIPLVLTNDRLAIQAAIYAITAGAPDNPRIVRIANTSHLAEIEISEALMEEALENPDIEIVQEPRFLSFDAHGNLF